MQGLADLKILAFVALEKSEIEALSRFQYRDHSGNVISMPYTPPLFHLVFRTRFSGNDSC